MKANAFLAFFFFVSFQLPFGANSASTAIYQDNFFEPHSAIQRKLHERDLQETGRAAHFKSVPAAPPSLFSSRQQRYSTKSGRHHHRRADNQVPTFSPTPLVSCYGSDVPFKLLFTADGSKGDLTADDDEGETIFSLDAGDSSYEDTFAFEHRKGKEEYQECLQADKCYVLSIKNDGSSDFPAHIPFILMVPKWCLEEVLSILINISLAKLVLVLTARRYWRKRGRYSLSSLKRLEAKIGTTTPDGLRLLEYIGDN
mmetsp:Transcript_993/g.1600  ORF Transcript_993/g.1600 Transcript_993/m.1600 type:complete len:256 (+) Transcript_993:591-1358(+)